MRVYADLFFALNAGADWALLVVAGRLAGLDARPWRLVAAAAGGGMYALAGLLVSVPLLFSPFGAVVAAAAMAWCAYAPLPPRALVRLLGCLYGAGALAAGLAQALAGMGAGGWGGVPWWAPVLGLGGALAIGGSLRDRWRPSLLRPRTCILEIAVGDRTAVCRALVDTGNGLRDPCGGGPAIVVDAAALRPIVPPALLAAMAAGPCTLPSGLAEAAAARGGGGRRRVVRLRRGVRCRAVAGGWMGRIRLLPFQTIGAPAGLLCAFRPDAVWLGTGGGRRRVRAVVGVSAQPLDPLARFAAVVPGSVVAAPGPALVKAASV